MHPPRCAISYRRRPGDGMGWNGTRTSIAARTGQDEATGQSRYSVVTYSVATGGLGGFPHAAIAAIVTLETGGGPTSRVRAAAVGD